MEDEDRPPQGKNLINPDFKAVISAAQPVTPPERRVLVSRAALRDYWHGILHEHGKYPCYGILLAHARDSEAIKYLVEYITEIDVLSGPHWLFMTLVNDPKVAQKTELLKVETGLPADFSLGEFAQVPQDELRKWLTEQHARASIFVAEHLGIPYDHLPALALFKDLRDSESVVIDLRGLDAQVIAGRVQQVSWFIFKAVKAGEDPLETMRRELARGEATVKGWTFLESLRQMGAKALDVAIEAMIQAQFE